MHLWQGVLQHILAVCTVYVGCGGEQFTNNVGSLICEMKIANYESNLHSLKIP